MIVRSADWEHDREAILSGVCDYMARHVDPYLLPSSEHDVLAIADGLRDKEEVEVLLADASGEIIGGIVLFLLPYPWNPGLRVAEEAVFWCADDAPPCTVRSLLRAAETVARQWRADIFVMHSLSYCTDAFGAVLQRLGFEPVQTSYMRRLS